MVSPSTSTYSARNGFSTRALPGFIAIVRRNDDIEDKLVVALSGEWDTESIMAAVRFQEQFFDSWVELAPLPDHE
jgi:hypothetical protein